MPDDAPNTENQQQDQQPNSASDAGGKQNEPDPKSATPPWGTDFDPERAWTLVQNLRTEKAALKTERDNLSKAQQEIEDAKKSDLEKAQDKASKLEKDAAEARRELLTERAIRKYGVPDDLAEFVNGADEAEINAKAERLAKVGKPDTNNDPASRRPQRDLRPGHAADGDPGDFDPDAIAKAARRR